MKQLIRTGNDPALHTPCTPVGAGVNLQPLMDLMERACKRAKTGVGLAAPQVGDNRRVIFTMVRDARGTVRGRFFVNPVVVAKSDRTNVDQEGCLSFPGVFKYVERHDAVTLRFEDARRIVRTEIIEGYHARVVQHELDHLEGVCLIGDPTFAGELRPVDVRRPVNPTLLVGMLATLAR